MRNLAKYKDKWSLITKNHFVLEIASQCKIYFRTDSPPVQTCPECKLRFSQQKSSVIDAELSKLLSQGVKMRAVYCQNQIISNIFIRPKNNGKYRLILNLAKFNENINYRHIKNGIIKYSNAYLFLWHIYLFLWHIFMIQCLSRIQQNIVQKLSTKP